MQPPSLPLLRRPPDTALQPGEPEGRVRGSLSGIATRPSRLLGDGDRCGNLLCIETPGHIPGHLAFLDGRDGTLYAGDARTAVGRLAVSGFAPWYFPFPNAATWDTRVAVSSAERLLSFPVERFACGHGPVRDGAHEALRSVLSGAAR